MSHQVRTVSALLLFSVVLPCAESAAATPNADSIRQLLVQRIDQEKRSVGIAVGFVGPDEQHVIGYGRLSADDPRTPDGSTVFEIGSISKVFTSIALADLITRGDVKLETPVQRLLGPEVQIPTRNRAEITLGHLATHSSGLPRLPDNLDPADPENPYADYGLGRLFAFLASHELARDIGEAVEYSNLGVGLLGNALARHGDTDYESLVTARILGPLGMADTAIGLTPALRERLATGHDKALKPAKNWDIPGLAGAGALRSTVSNLLLLIEANLGVRESPLRDAIAMTHAPRRPFPGPGMEIGLGWLIRSRHDRSIIWHNGGTGGYRSFLGFDLDAGTGVVVLSSSADSVDDLGFHLLDSRFKLAPPPAQPTKVEIDPAVYADYVGRYQLAKDVILTVTSEDDRLFVQLTGQQRFAVFPESTTRFFLREVEAQISFGRDDRGAVDHLVLHQNGLDQRAIRLGEGVNSIAHGPAETVAVAQAALERYVGRYELQPGFVITVTRQDAQLSAQATGQPSAEIYASSDTEFFYRVVEASITFHVEASAVTKLTLHQGGRELVARRLPD